MPAMSRISCSNDGLPSPDDWSKFPPPLTRDVDSSTASSLQASPFALPCRLVGHWRIGQLLGRGSAGSVRLARSTINSQYAAIKSCKWKSQAQRKLVAREIEMLRLAAHPNVVQLYQVLETQDCLFLVLEYCRYGTLYSLITRVKLSQGVIRRFFAQIIEALNHMHTLLIAHRDLKAENIFLFEDEQLRLSVKLGDLGLSARGDLLVTACGSPHYVSPEVIAGMPYDGLLADVWSCGVVLYTMIARRLPFEGDSVPDLLNKIRHAKFEMHESISGHARHLLVERVLVKDPEQRLCTAQIRSHPFLLATERVQASQFRDKLGAQS